MTMDETIERVVDAALTGSPIQRWATGAGKDYKEWAIVLINHSRDLHGRLIYADTIHIYRTKPAPTIEMTVWHSAFSEPTNLTPDEAVSIIRRTWKQKRGGD